MPQDTPEIAAAIAQPMPLEPELDEARKELVALINRITRGQDGTVETPVAGLQVFCISKPDGPKHAFATPALGLIAQGSKRIIVGDDIYVYDPMHYLVTSVDLPVCGQVRLTSDNEPYLGVRLELAIDEIGKLIGDEKLPAKANAPASAACTSTASACRCWSRCCGCCGWSSRPRTCRSWRRSSSARSCTACW